MLGKKDNDNEKLVEELTAIIKEFGKPAKIMHTVRSSDIDDDEFVKDFLKMLAGEDGDTAKANEAPKPDHKCSEPENKVPNFDWQGKDCVKEEAAEEDDFETFVGGLVVDAVEVEDDGERMYFCSVDDDAFYMPKAVFDKYFVKI